jgi:hypothetical protein
MTTGLLELIHIGNNRQARVFTAVWIVDKDVANPVENSQRCRIDYPQAEMLENICQSFFVLASLPDIRYNNEEYCL